MGERRGGFVRAGFRRAGTGGSVTPPTSGNLVGSVDTVNTSGAKLSAFASSTFTAGALVWVESVGAYFRLKLSALAVDDLTVETASGKAGYQWIRVDQNNRNWQAQAAWTIDPTNSTGLASDENAGANVGAPLLTYAEHARRLAFGVLGQNTTTTVLGSQQAGDNPTYTYWNQKGITKTFVSVPTVLFASTVTGFAALTFGVAATDDAQFVDAAVPGGSFTAAGVLAKGVVIKRTNGTAIYAWALKDLGATTLRVSQPYNPAATTTRPAFVIGDTYQALQLPQVLSVRGTDTLPAGTKWTQFDWRSASGFDFPAFTDTVYFSTLGNTFSREIILANNPCFDTGAINVTAQPQITVTCGAFKGAGNTRYTFLETVANMEGNVVCCQGARLMASNGIINATQLNFYDETAECAQTDTGSRIHLLGFVNGKGNVGKVFIAGQGTQIVFTQAPPLFLAGITTDAAPYQAGVISSAAPIKLQDDGNGVFQTSQAGALSFITRPVLSQATPAALAALTTLGSGGYPTGQQALVTAMRVGGGPGLYTLQPAISTTPDSFFVIATADDATRQWVSGALVDQATLSVVSAELDLTAIQTVILLPPISHRLTNALAIGWIITQKDGTIVTGPTAQAGSDAGITNYAPSTLQAITATAINTKGNFTGALATGFNGLDLSVGGMKVSITAGAALGTATVFKARLGFLASVFN